MFSQRPCLGSNQELDADGKPLRQRTAAGDEHIPWFINASASESEGGEISHFT